MAAARSGGLLITTAGKDALRLVPPLILEEADIAKAERILAQALVSGVL